jgi:hypothetical protein
MDFPESALRLPNLLGMVMIQHQPAGNPYLGALLGMLSERL